MADTDRAQMSADFKRQDTNYRDTAKVETRQKMKNQFLTDRCQKTSDLWVN